MSNVSNLKEISRDEFLAARLSQECEKDSPDKVAICTLLNHLTQQGQKYYRATLTKDGIHNLIIAHHKHGEDLMVSEGGQPLADIVGKYAAEEPHNECWQKVAGMKEIIAQEVQKTGGIFPESMMPFVSDVPDLAVKGEGHYREYGPEHLYIGGYHRFVAYCLWVKENDFQPLRLYYCEARGTAR